MREFFRGWRRKIDVMTLVMAGVLIWGVVFRGFTHIYESAFDAGIYPGDFPGLGIIWSLSNEEQLLRQMGADPDRLAGAIALPLAMLSAYLLISKPRVAKPPEST